MIEFLKLIKGYKDYYISNLGEVYSTKGKVGALACAALATILT